MNNINATLIKYLPLRIAQAVNSLPDEILCCVNEIRLRHGRPLSLTVGSRNLFIDEHGKLCRISQAIKATKQEIDEAVCLLTECSRYSFDWQIAHGFISLPDGSRAGVCGRADEKGGFLEIEGINLRLHRFLPNVAKGLIDYFSAFGLCGVLVCSPPAMGKTTYLRSAAYLLGAGIGISPTRVGIADERCEIAPALPLGAGLIDVVSAIPKQKAITMLTRTMSPEVIICDEIAADEADAVLETQNTGVSLIASAHCDTPAALARRKGLYRMVEQGVFRLFIVIGEDYSAKIFNSEELL